MFIATTSLFLAVDPNSENLHYLVYFGLMAEKHAMMRYDGCGVCDLFGFAIENIFPASNHQEGVATDKLFSDVFPVGFEAIHLRIWHEMRSNTGRDVPFESI